MTTSITLVMRRLEDFLPLLFAVACDKATAPEPPLPLPVTDRIIFQSDRSDPLGDVYAMKFDGTGILRLTSSRLGETCPSISPDGNRIAYFVGPSDPAAFPAIYAFNVMAANGTGNLTFAEINFPVGCPLWSKGSDAIEVTYVTSAPAKSAYTERNRVFDIAGHELASFDGLDNYFTTLAADGTQLLGAWSMCGFNGCTVPDIGVINRDGTGHRWLTGDTTNRSFRSEGGLDPTLSPDGLNVVYICHNPADLSLGAVCMINWDGTSKRQIAIDGWAHPKFSPDGKRLSFACGKVNTPDLCAMDIDGTNLTRWPAIGRSSRAGWTPNGDRLVFECGTDICTATSDGGPVLNLTQGHGTNTNPSVVGW